MKFLNLRPSKPGPPLFLLPLLIGIAALCGILLYRSFGVDTPLLNSLAMITLIVSPLFLVHIAFAEYALVAVVLLTLPLNVDQQLFLNENHLGGAQGWILSLNGLALFYLYLLLMLRVLQGERPHFDLFPRIGLPFVVLIVFCVMSLTKGSDRLLGLFEVLEVIKMYLIFIYIYFFIIRTGSTTFVLVMVLSGLFLENMIALAQKMAGSNLGLELLGASRRKVSHQSIGVDTVYRIGGTLGNGNSLAWYLDFILPIPLAVFLWNRKHWLGWLSLACLLSGSLVLLFTFSRGGWLSFFLAGVIVVFFQLRKMSVQRKLIAGVFTLLFLGLAVTLLFGIDNPVKRRFTADDNRAAYVRIPLMQVAVNMIKHNLILGVGLNNYTIVDQNFDNTHEKVTSHFPYPVHNTFLQLGAEVGVLGLMAFLFFLFNAYRENLKFILAGDALENHIGIGILAGTTGAMFQAIVENGTIGSYHLLPLWILTAWMFAMKHTQMEQST